MNKIRKALKAVSDKDKAKVLQGFFKTGEGQYGEGDVFVGVVVPEQRKIAKAMGNEVSLEDIKEILKSVIHEERMVALFILVEQYKKAGRETRQKIFDFYFANTARINNWDLVDLSAPNIVGDFLLDKERAILYSFAKSKSLWEKRIAILATFTFIKNNEFTDTLKISEMLLRDSHDLIHKAVGWMLREVGKRNLKIEVSFLDEYANKMPRTMLRYAIERFPEELRKMYLGRKEMAKDK